jgi:hypothetical protein
MWEQSIPTTVDAVWQMESWSVQGLSNCRKLWFEKMVSVGYIGLLPVIVTAVQHTETKRLV